MSVSNFDVSVPVRYLLSEGHSDLLGAHNVLQIGKNLLSVKFVLNIDYKSRMHKKLC